MGLNAYIIRVFVQLTDFGLSKVGLISSTDDLSGPTVAGATLMEEITKHHNASVEQPQHRERRQQRSAVGTPDYLAPEILLGTSHGIFSYWTFGRRISIFHLLANLVRPPMGTTWLRTSATFGDLASGFLCLLAYLFSSYPRDVAYVLCCTGLQARLRIGGLLVLFYLSASLECHHSMLSIRR